MNKIILSLLSILVFASCVSAMSYDEASTQNKPILLYVTMTGCGACQKFDVFFQKVQPKYSSKYNFVKENVNGSQMAVKLRVNSTPSVYIIKPQDKTAQKIKWECLRNYECFEKTLGDYN